jgi:hypothetical protein
LVVLTGYTSLTEVVGVFVMNFSALHSFTGIFKTFHEHEQILGAIRIALFIFG